MVMPNRHDGANSPGWWDDLPSSVKRRISKPDPSTPAHRSSERQEEAPYRPAVVADLSRLAILFFVVALANVVFLLIALSFLFGRGPLAP
jgi:hypothetical protein